MDTNKLKIAIGEQIFNHWTDLVNSNLPYAEIVERLNSAKQTLETEITNGILIDQKYIKELNYLNYLLS